MKTTLMNKVGVFLSLFAFCFSAFGDCRRGDIDISLVNPVFVDFTSNASQVVTFQVTHQPFTGPRNCFYFSTLNYGSGSLAGRLLTDSLSAGTIPFNVHKASPPAASNILRDHFDVTSVQHIVYFPIFNSSPGVQTNTHTFFAQLGTVPTGLSPGFYTEALVLKVVARPTTGAGGGLSDWPVVTEEAIQFAYRIQHNLELSIVPTGGAHDPFDTAELFGFGELKTGKTLTADAMVTTNVGYKMYFSSFNNGALKHQLSTSNIPYTLSVSGTPLNLSGSSTTPVLASSSPVASPAGGFRIPLSVQVGAISGTEPAGVYSDVVQVTVEAY